MEENTSRPADRLRNLREALLDLAYDAHSYLRHHARSAVRLSAALLIAASLAACAPSAGDTFSPVIPLSSEVRTGLPSQPGRYPIVNGTLGRDQQGVYHFAWRQPYDPPTTRNFASLSLARLAQSSSSEVEILPQGDPVLYLPPNAQIPLINSAEDVRSGSAYGGLFPYWYPFYGGYRGSGYYDPPARTASGTTVNGATISTSPAPAASRVVGLSRAVSGRAGGSGPGTAATTKGGASVGGASAATSVRSGGAAAAKSGSFSAGTGGASVRSSSS
ncbi:MAG TPA: hypothetical protein VKT80_02610 [Chloroflexota bacterium]|nr:hypothetical protein [Chloroflexota bacterium]